MPPPPAAIIKAGEGGTVNVKVRRIGQVVPISSTAVPPAGALKGKHRLLVILVETNDSRWPKSGYSRSRFNEMIFARSTLSLREYFRENSYGAYDVTGAVVGPIRVRGSMSDFSFAMGAKNTRVKTLVERAVRGVRRKVDFKKFDTHGHIVLECGEDAAAKKAGGEPSTTARSAKAKKKATKRARSGKRKR